jgi:hypothetical protein
LARLETVEVNHDTLGAKDVEFPQDLGNQLELAEPMLEHLVQRHRNPFPYVRVFHDLLIEEVEPFPERSDDAVNHLRM